MLELIWTFMNLLELIELETYFYYSEEHVYLSRLRRVGILFIFYNKWMVQILNQGLEMHKGGKLCKVIIIF